MSNEALFISDRRYINSDIMGGVQLCTREFIRYISAAGYNVREFHVEPVISLVTKIKIKAGIDVYQHYAIKKYLPELIRVINNRGTKMVFFNQLSLAFWAGELRQYVPPDVKFIGLSHGNESADYLHDITKKGIPTKFQAWKLGMLLVNEAKLYSSLIDGIIVISEQEIAINQWLGANNVLFLPRFLEPDFTDWQPLFPNAGFVGTLDHLPNRLGIEQLAEELKLLSFTYKIMLVGGPPKIGNQLAKKYEFIMYKGQLEDKDLLSELKTWSVFINPVFWFARGSSTKLTRALNWGIPCITTPAGKRGYHLTDETIVTAGNTPKTFARQLIKALDEPAYLDKLKRATEDNAKNFDAQPYINQLKSFLHQLSRQ